MIKIYLTQPHEMYTSSEQAKRFSALSSTTYANMYREELSFLDENMDRIREELPLKITFIDLGPGDGTVTHKWLKKLEDRIEEYIAVDIQEQFLHVADAIAEMGLNVKKYRMLIENYLALNLYSERNRFFHLGMSYSNFPDNRMIQLLHTKTSQKDNIWLAGQIGPLNAGAGDLKAYQDCAQIIFEPFVERYGLQGGRIKVKYDLEKNEVQVGYLVGKVFLILGISKKLDEIDFRTPLIPHFKGKYFTNKKMIGFLGSTNEGDNYNPSYCGPP